MKIEQLDYDELSDDEKDAAPNNGNGKDLANYIRITFDGGKVFTQSDAMEPEDARFTRDLSWIVEMLKLAYAHGAIDQKSVQPRD